MRSLWSNPVGRWTTAFGALAAIVLLYQRLHVNPTTVALTLVLLVLVLASQWELRYPVLVSVAAAAAYNFYFLPPVGTFVVSDPENWMALVAFLATSLIGSRLSQKVRAEAEKARKAMEDAARSEAREESERLRTLILDSITHELRTPLTSIKGAAGALLSAPELDAADRRELASIVDEEADRLNRLVGQAVEMARLEAREIQMHMEPLSMLQLVQEAQEECAWVAATHVLELQLDGLPDVLGDREMLGKVICNLLENAAKYSAAGTPIRVSAEVQDGRLLVSVADEGVGIALAEQNMIFDRLYRSRTQMEATPGTGMGLAICRAILEAHQGSLSVRSRLGEGSVFTFSLALAGE